MLYFCTYLNASYIPKYLALYRSLRRRNADFRFCAICLDDISHSVLQSIGDSFIVPVSVASLESWRPELLTARQNRTPLEYYYTIQSAVPLYTIDAYRDCEIAAYLDADLYFYDSFDSILHRFRGSNVLITPLRHPSGWELQTEMYGLYNAGFGVFRNNSQARACLERWFSQCLDWCCDRVECGRFANQKYLDDWPTRFEGVTVLEHNGANLAFWNWSQYAIRASAGRVFVDEDPLLFCHHSRLRRICRHVYAANFLHPFRIPTVIRRHCVLPYVRELISVERWLEENCGYRHSNAADLRRSPRDLKGILQAVWFGNMLVSSGTHSPYSQNGG